MTDDSLMSQLDEAISKQTKELGLELKGNASDVFSDDEPQILFLGTSSMKPTHYRGASGVYYFGKGGAVLMDSAEGSYGQLWDHFGTKAKVDEVLIKTVCIFITHIHGDHQLGIIKMMQERDILLSSIEEKTPMFVVLPLPMIEWVSTYQA